MLQASGCGHQKSATLSELMDEVVFTIGHSTHSQERFISLLRKHAVAVVCDVRSQPYSRANPQFNREILKQFLHARGIRYVFLGRELGARSEDATCYVNGKVQYDRLAQTELFHRGLHRVETGMKKFRIVLMCAERDPIECHRTILVARYLSKGGVTIRHIHADGSIETHVEAMQRLARQLHLRVDEHDFFQSPADLFEQAYRLQGARIAYDSGETGSANGRQLKSAAG